MTSRSDMVSPVWRYSLQNVPATQPTTTHTVIHTFLQEEGQRALRVDVSPCGSKLEVFVLNVERRMPQRHYDALQAVQVTTATEVVGPLSVPPGWSTYDVAWTIKEFVVAPAHSVGHPAAAVIDGAPMPYALALALCRPSADATRRQRRTDITDLGTRWSAPHVGTNGRALYTWFEFVYHHGVERGSCLWDLGEESNSLCDIATLDIRFPVPVAAPDAPPDRAALIKRVCSQLIDRLADVPGGWASAAVAWGHSGKCSPEHAREILRTRDHYIQVIDAVSVGN